MGVRIVCIGCKDPRSWVKDLEKTSLCAEKTSSCVKETSFCGVMASFQVLSYAGEMSFHSQGRSSFIRRRMILQQQQGGSRHPVPVMKANVLHSNQGGVEFMYDCTLPPRKYFIAVHTHCGRGKDHKAVVCLHEVSSVEA